MEFVLKFKMDNAAFSQYPEGEIERILKETADKVVAGQVYGSVMDYNGNKVGDWDIED